LLRVAVGEEITITRKGVPIARLIGVEPKPGPRKLGAYRDEIWIADDFDAPLRPDILAGFLGEQPPRGKRKKI
jgi:antitoxin (DNA-binding transcriptional repressor) of toxin-antitoxin stability system